MSKTSIKLLYRYLCKNIEESNRNLFREALQKGLDVNLNKQEAFIQYYLQMKKHIDQENKLLQSYNINIVRDSRREIESVARKVGLQI